MVIVLADIASVQAAGCCCAAPFRAVCIGVCVTNRIVCGEESWYIMRHGRLVNETYQWTCASASRSVVCDWCSLLPLRICPRRPMRGLQWRRRFRATRHIP